MSDENNEQELAKRAERLEKILLESDFDGRYYGWIASHGGPPQKVPLDAEVVSASIARLPLTFKYNRKEKFFGHRQKFGVIELGLNIAVWNSAVWNSHVEVILVFKTPLGHIGCPFQMLARVVGQTRDPAFTPVPRAPQLPFHSIAKLEEALAFALQLYEEIKEKVLAQREQFE